ncbi:Hypothetical predicted protein [Olea europaea subsp. europaea]|uniref:Uncharacterized protein n=1 Tax=Olea europaea subsp. europaea TaxID=158383 RepID=A0A8S0PYS5_OLEEU|nr:Hypothetical predicted protein [Olea europaea subsp. europaea]
MRKAGKGNDDTSSHGAGFMSGETTPSSGFSPVHLLHNHNHKSSASDSKSIPNSLTSYLSSIEISKLEASIRGREERRQPHNTSETNEESHSIDFSFNKS